MEFLSQPSLLVALVELAVGFVILTFAADEFVEGAANVAYILRISPVVIGAVIIGFGTSAPELLVSTISAYNGDLNLGVGNVVGSNVANLSLVLGVSALIVPLVVSPSVLSREAPLSLLAVLGFAYFTRDGLERWEGLVMLGALAGVMVWVVAAGGGEELENAALAGVSATAPDGDGSRSGDNKPQVKPEVIRTVIGLIGTVSGAQLLVWGAVGLADRAGLSGGFVGFTLVAVGTSLPELTTAIAGSRRGETDLILGNLLGSNIFNSLAVGGVISVVRPGPITDPNLASVGVPAMVIVALVAWVFMVTRRRVYRLEGLVLLALWLLTIAAMASGSTT